MTKFTCFCGLSYNVQKSSNLGNALAFPRKLFTLVMLLLFVGVGNALAAENDKHDFPQTLEQLLNNKASIADVTVAEQSYTVKEVKVTVNYNKTAGGATVSVKVGGTTFGSAQTINSSTTTTFTYTGASAVKGQVVVSSVNNCTASSKCGTFKITNVQLVEGAAAGPSISTSVSSLNDFTYSSSGVPNKKTFTVSGTSLTNNVTVTPPTGYEICQTENGTYTDEAITLSKGTGTLSATTIYVKLKSGLSAGSKSGNVVCASSGATSKNVALSGSVPFKVTWKANGATHATTYVAYATSPGTAIGSFPDDPDPDDYTCSGTNRAFYGWYDGSYSHASTAPTIITTSTKISSDKIYNAVFATEADGGTSTKWVLTALNAVTAGTYAIVNQTDHAFNGTINSSGHGDCTTETFTFVNGEAASAPSGTCEITIATQSSGFSMYNTSTEKYLYASKAASGGFAEQASKPDNYWCYYNPNWEYYKSYSGSYAVLRSYNATTGGLRVYGANNGDGVIKLAKKTTISIKTYSNYMTACCTELASINGSVSWTNGTKATLVWNSLDHVAASTPYTITYRTGSAAYGSTNVSAIRDTLTRKKTCVITGLTAGTSYDFKIAVSPASGYCDKESVITATAPKITLGSASGTSVYIEGDGPGSKKTFTVSAVGLTGNLTVTAPTNFEVCATENGTYASSITITPSSGAVSTTVYFRLVTGKTSASSPYAGNVTVSGGGASEQTVSVSGTVSPACENPTITTQPATPASAYRIDVTATNLSVTATKGSTSPTLTYQWYSNSSDNNTSGELIDGATSSSYTPPTSSPGTVYYYCEVSSGACMTASNCAAITVSTPTITVSETSRAFGTKAKDSSSTMTFTVSGSDLGANIGLAISGTNAAMFSIDKTSLTHSSGTVSTQTITVTYNPTAVGSHTAQINITSTGATTKTVSLSGTGAWPVEWYVGGTDSDYKLTSGSQSTLATNGSNVSALTFPTSSQTTIECGGKTFVGWTNTSSYTHGTSPLFTQATATGTITSAVKYYAVFAEASVNSEELTESEIKSQFTTYSHKYDDSDVSYTDGDVTWNAKYNVDATDRPWIQFNNTAYMQITAPGKITKVELIVTSTSNKSGGIADKTQYNAFGSAVTLSLLTATSAGTNVGSSTTNTEDSYQEITINVSSGDNTSLYLMSSAAYRLWGITVTYGGYSDHLLTCTTCNKVTVSYSDPSHATLSVKKSAAVISSGTQVSTCSSQTLTVKVTPDAANHYWMTAMSISGVTGVTTDPSTTSGLPTKEQKSYSVTIPKDATGTLIITPTIEAIPQKTISFLVNGDDAEDNSPQDIYVGEKPELPTVPDDNELSCAEAFVGWSTNELTETGNAEPADLFFTSTATPTVTDDVTYHAVFASKDGSKSGKYTLDYSDETSLSGSSSWGYGTALEYTATDGSTWAVKAYKNSGMQINTGKDCSIKIPDCPSGATITTIEITGSTSKAVGISASDYSGSGTITYIATGTDATSQTLDLRGLEVTGGYIVPKSGSIVITKIVVNYAKYKDYMTYCTKIFTDAAGADHNWSTAGNWSGGVPTIKDRARIQKPVTVDVATAKAKNVVLDQSGSPTKTGQLILDAGKELTVAETVRKTTDGSTYSATGEDDIVFNSTSSAGLGALVVGSHDGTNQATVNFYSKSHGSKNSNESVNQFVGTPFNDANVLYNWYNSWIYEFTNTSGTASWKRIKDGDEMTPFHGYCVISAENEMNPGHMYWQQGTLVASEDQNLTLAYYNSENTENMFANSWMAPIKISEMNGHMTNTTGTIYIFNSGSAKDGDGSKTDGSAGNYSTYTPGTAGSNVIPAMQAFTVYATAAGSLSLDYSAYVYDPAVAGTTPVANKAPQRVGTAEDEMEHLKLRVACENGWGDALDIYIREDFSEGFEMYYDGPKIEGDEQAPMLYAVTDDGKMAINCVPDAEGTVVGFRRGEDTNYQFTFDYEGDEVLYLNDLKEQISTPISMDRSYTFTSAAGDMQARFIISHTPIHNTPTGVEANSQRSKVESRKLLIDDHVFIIRNGQMYDVTGIRVRESNK